MRATAITLAAPAALSATDTGAAVNVMAFHGLVEFVMTSTATGGAGQTSTVTIEHSDNGTDGWASAGIAFESVDDTAASTQQVLANVDQMKKFVRAVTTLDGATPTVTRAVLMVGNRNYE